MAEEEDVSKGDLPQKLPPPEQFVEVICKSSQKPRRFAAGTDAGFAVSLINRKLGAGVRVPALYIEAAKEGEEPVNFGPNAVLVDYGVDWRLQTVTEVDLAGNSGNREGFQPNRVPSVNADGSGAVKLKVSKPGIDFLYVAKIFIAFVLIFVLGAIFTLALEYLPELILSINSFM